MKPLHSLLVVLISLICIFTGCKKEAFTTQPGQEPEPIPEPVIFYQDFGYTKFILSHDTTGLYNDYIEFDVNGDSLIDLKFNKEFFDYFCHDTVNTLNIIQKGFWFYSDTATTQNTLIYARYISANQYNVVGMTFDTIPNNLPEIPCCGINNNPYFWTKSGVIASAGSLCTTSDLDYALSNYLAFLYKSNDTPSKSHFGWISYESRVDTNYLGYPTGYFAITGAAINLTPNSPIVAGQTE